jgi:hypothetical protein
MSLQAAVLYLNDIVGAISGINGAPDYPTESQGTFPFSICYPGSGEFEWEPYEALRGRHIINLEVHFNRSNLAKAMKEMLPMVEAVRDVLKTDPTLGGNVDTIIASGGQAITYTTVYVEIGEVKTIALRFRIPVKIKEGT